MVYKTNCCCYDRTGKCTTRFYRPDLVADPADSWTWDHGRETSHLAQTNEGGSHFTWVLGGNYISKIGTPDYVDPLTISSSVFNQKILYSPPAGAAGTSQGSIALEILEMRTLDDETGPAVVIGTTVTIQLKDPTTSIPITYDDFTVNDIPNASYLGPHGNLSAALVAADVCGKQDIGFLDDLSNGDPLTSVGGFFRCQVNQWLGSSHCGTVTIQDDDSVGSTTWINPGAAEESGVDEATATGEDETSHYLRAYFDFSSCIPADALSIQGVTVQIDRYASDDSSTVNIKDAVVRLVLGSLVGDNKADTVNEWPTTLSGKVYGGTSDDWGTGMTVTQARGTVGLVLQVSHGNHGVDAFVDHMSMAITYIDAASMPQTVTIGTVLDFAPTGWLGPIYGDDDVFLGGTGVFSDFLTEPIPFDISGADLATIIDGYLDAVYTCSGTGSITSSTNITLTFTHDGSLDDGVIIDGNGEGIPLVAVTLINAFPDEAASLHVLNTDGTMRWSKCGVQTYSSSTGIASNSFTNRRVTKIYVDPDNQWITTFGESYGALNRPASFYQVNQFDFDGEPLDNGAYTVKSQPRTGSYRDWKHVDHEGYGYHQQTETFGRGETPPDYVLKRYGPAGPDAQEDLQWACNLGWAITAMTDTSGTVYVAGFTKIAAIDKTTGAIDWESDIPTNYNRYGSFDIIVAGLFIFLAANNGVYTYDSGGSLYRYFPHGTRCRGVMFIQTDELEYLVLTGATADVDPDPGTYDIDPVTLT